ncbi:segregation and condensation protein A [Entomobacter blattae]|uniref:Segregation and condensation protein A n=1 Tax=Entomobacter blattae TaxID=2762277 RepID=A0A7H1NUB3_9PROT|nr:ScpA family protein [Entomobacter blattae]QNT79373.1 Segregation and condensation protein A [Entomobacter blattae]
MDGLSVPELVLQTQETSDPSEFCVRLEGFEGPLDLLLELARQQKVDLRHISILQMVEQYLAIIANMQVIRLELAADWLVMAAWLAWLKSRLLLPSNEEEQLEGEEAASLLQAQVIEYSHISKVANWLGHRPQLGQEVFVAGSTEEHVAYAYAGLAVSLPQLLKAYLSVMRKRVAKRPYKPRQLSFWTVQEALEYLHVFFAGEEPVLTWHKLEEFVPNEPTQDTRQDTTQRQKYRAAMAGTLLASLEMARSGVLEIHQEEEFGMILLRSFKKN